VAHTEQRQSAGLPAVSVPAVAVRDPRSVIGRRTFDTIRKNPGNPH
jgi:hypothetical protein